MRRAFLFKVEPAQISPSGPGYSPAAAGSSTAAGSPSLGIAISQGQPSWHGCSLWEFKGQAPCLHVGYL